MVDLLEKARAVREQATAAAAEIASQASARAGELKDSAADRARDLRDGLAAAATDLWEGAAAKVREVLEDFNASLPVLQDMGYVLVDVSITVGMAPNLRATFDVSHEVTDEEVARVLGDCADKRLTTFLVRALSQGRRLQASVAVAGMKPRGIAVEIGIAPSVAIKFA
jgi:hypothetical protein